MSESRSWRSSARLLAISQAQGYAPRTRAEMMARKATVPSGESRGTSHLRFPGSPASPIARVDAHESCHPAALLTCETHQARTRYIPGLAEPSAAEATLLVELPHATSPLAGNARSASDVREQNGFQTSFAFSWRALSCDDDTLLQPCSHPPT